MKVTTFEELKDRHLGKIGTPERDAYEAEVREAIQSYHIGEAIKAARINLTPASNLVDEVWGKVGTPERDKMETQLKRKASI